LREIEERTMAGTPGRGTDVAAQARRSSASKSSKRAPIAAGAKVAEAEATHTTAPSAMAQGLRRSDRVLLKIPLEVSGTDLQGNSITERAHTQVINRNGASLVLRNAFRPDGQMTVKNLHTGQSCRFRACRVSQDIPGGLREWGVECLDPAPNFWGITFVESPQVPYVEEEGVGSLLECTMCHYREMTKLAVPEYRTVVQKTSLARHCTWCGKETEWKLAIVKEDLEATGPQALKEGEVAFSPASGAERPLEERRTARVPISIRHADGREELTITENLSRSGICCVANMELQVGDRVFLRLVSGQGPGEAELPAQIMWRKTNEKGGFFYGMKLERDQSPAV